MGLNFNPGWALSKGLDPAQPNSISNPLPYFGPFLWFIGGAKRRVKEKKVVWRQMASRVGHKPQPRRRVNSVRQSDECKLLCTYVCSVFRWAKMGACMHVYIYVKLMDTWERSNMWHRWEAECVYCGVCIVYRDIYGNEKCKMGFRVYPSFFFSFLFSLLWCLLAVVVVDLLAPW